MFKYARENMLRLSIYIRQALSLIALYTACRDPYVTLYKRDVEMNWITWIANTGQNLSLKRPKTNQAG